MSSDRIYPLQMRTPQKGPGSMSKMPSTYTPPSPTRRYQLPEQTLSKSYLTDSAVDGGSLLDRVKMEFDGFMKWITGK